MKSSTEVLRALLDERGVEWTEPTDEYWELLGGIPTRNYVTIIGEKYVEEALDGTLAAYHLTPEQAVEATLGRGTCRALDGESSSGAPLQAGDYDEFWEPAGVCSECGELIPLRNYCPNCGRAVVE